MPTQWPPTKKGNGTRVLNTSPGTETARKNSRHGDPAVVEATLNPRRRARSIDVSESVLARPRSRARRVWTYKTGNVGALNSRAPPFRRESCATAFKNVAFEGLPEKGARRNISAVICVA